MSSNRVTKSLQDGEGTGSPQHVTRFYAEVAAAEIRIMPKTESAYEGESAFVLEGYDPEKASDDAVFEHAVSASGTPPEADGTIKIRIRPGDGDGEVPRKSRLENLRYRLIHRPLGEENDACEDPLFEHASFEQAWGPEPMAEFDEVAFAEAADVTSYKNRLVPDETTLHDEKTQSLRTREAAVQVETEAGEWEEANEKRPRWAYAFSVTEAKEGANCITIHEWKADEDGNLACVDVEAGPSDDREPEEPAQESALLPTRWILAGPSAPKEQAHATPEYGFWLSQEKLPAQRLEYIRDVLGEVGGTKFMPVKPLDPTLHKIETSCNDLEWMRTVLLADPFVALQHRYEQFRDALERLSTIVNEAAPLRATADIAKDLAQANNEAIRTGVQEAAAPAQLKREPTGADVGPKHQFRPVRQEETAEPLWKTWRSEYQEQVEALREQADEAAQRVVDVFEHDTFKAAYVDYELSEDTSRMRADHLAGRARRGLSAVPSGRDYLASLVESSRGRYRGTTNLTASSLHPLDVLWKESRRMVRGTLNTFVEVAGHVAAQTPEPDESLRQMARLIRTALEFGNDAVDESANTIRIGEMVKLTGFEKPVTPSVNGRRYLAEIEETLLEQRLQSLRSEQQLQSLAHYKTTIGGVLELVNVVNAAINAGAAADDVREKRLREGQALTGLLTFVLNEPRTRVEQSMKKQKGRPSSAKLDDLAKGGGGRMSLAIKGLRFAVLTGLAIGATIEVVLAHRAVEESLEEYDSDSAWGKRIIAGGTVAMTIGSAVALFRGEVFLGLGWTGWGLVVGLISFAAGGIVLYFADPRPVQWFVDTQWALSDVTKEKAIRTPLLPELKRSRLQESVSDDKFTGGKKRAREMVTAYAEQVVGHVEVTARCGRLSQTLLPMLQLDVVAPVMTDAYYAWISLDPTSSVTVTPGGVEGENGELVSFVPMCKVSASGDPEIQSEVEARELKAKPGRIRLGFYDAKLKGDVKRKHRNLIQKKGIQLIPVRQLEQRLSEVKEPKVEVEFHPYGLVDQYNTASDLYEPDRL